MGLIACGGTGHRIDCYLSAMGLLAAYVWLCVRRCGLRLWERGWLERG